MRTRYLTPTTIAAVLLALCAAPQAFAQSAPGNNYRNPAQFQFDINGQSGQEPGFGNVLEFETAPIEYRDGIGNAYYKAKQPGLQKYGNINMKRGTFGDMDLIHYEFEPDCD